MCQQYCLVIRKFLDENGNGLREATEPMLPGVPFELTVDNEVHRRETGELGEIWFCRSEAEVVAIRELSRETGGLYALTTHLPPTWSLACGATELWIGNAYLAPPKTGLGGTIGAGRGGSFHTL